MSMREHRDYTNKQKIFIKYSVTQSITWISLYTVCQIYMIFIFLSIRTNNIVCNLPKDTAGLKSVQGGIKVHVICLYLDFYEALKVSWYLPSKLSKLHVIVISSYLRSVWGNRFLCVTKTNRNGQWFNKKKHKNANCWIDKYKHAMFLLTKRQ